VSALSAPIAAASSAVFFALSFLSIIFIGALKDEDYPDPEPRQRLRETLRLIPQLVRNDRPYARFLIARSFLAQAPWMAIYPGIAIFLTVLGFNLLGDGLHDALDPKDE